MVCNCLDYQRIQIISLIINKSVIFCNSLLVKITSLNVILIGENCIQILFNTK